MREDKLIQLRNLLLIDLLKIRDKLKTRLLSQQETNTLSFTEIDDVIGRIMTIDEKIEVEIDRRLRAYQLRRMFGS